MTPENSLSMISLITKISQFLFFANIIIIVCIIVYKKKKKEKIQKMVVIGLIVAIVILLGTGLLTSLAAFPLYNLQ